MLQLHRIRPIPHADQLWHGKVVCRQYVQGYCSYGTRCKYDHPLASGEQWFDPQPLSICSETSSSREDRLPSHDLSDGRYLDGLCTDTTRLHSQYSMARWLGNGTFVHGNKVPQSQLGAPNGPMDPKKIRSIIAWKTTPCKHFVKNNGWCPLGDACNFIHDWQLVYSTMWNGDIIRQTVESSSRPDGSHKATSHCWAHVQGFCGARNCPHFHPADIQPYVKYTPCPAWILCDKRNTCPFKHFDALPSGAHEPELMAAQAPQQVLPPPPLPPQGFYPPPAPLPAPTAYTPPNVSTHKPVEVNGTTYFPLTHDVSVPNEYGSYTHTAPMSISAPIAAQTPPPDLPATHSMVSESVDNPLLMLPPSYQTQAEAYQPPVEPSEQACVDGRPSSPQKSFAETPIAVAQMENIQVDRPELCPTKPEPESESADIPSDPGADPQSNKNISAETDKGDHQRKRRSHGHVRRISINVKTGEVVERTLEGRYGVYGL